MVTRNQLNLTLAEQSGTGKFAGTVSPTFETPILGVPQSGDLSTCSDYPLSALTGLGTNVEAWLAAPTSANLIAAVTTDNTGTGALVFATNPVFVTPNIGTPSAGVLTNCTGLLVTGGGTGVATSVAYGVQVGGTTDTGAHQVITPGTAGKVLTSGGASAVPTWETAGGGGGGIVFGTPQATTSGGVFTFSSLPALIKRITLMSKDFTTTGSQSFIRLGTSAGIATTGYKIARFAGGSQNSISTTQIKIDDTPSSNGGGFTSLVLTRYESGSDVWIVSGLTTHYDEPNQDTHTVIGSVSLPGELDRWSINSTSGAMNGGSANYTYEL